MYSRHQLHDTNHPSMDIVIEIYTSHCLFEVLLLALSTNETSNRQAKGAAR